MKDYYCNDCDENVGYECDKCLGICYLSLLEIVPKPKYCPISDEKEKCNWREM